MSSRVFSLLIFSATLIAWAGLAHGQVPADEGITAPANTASAPDVNSLDDLKRKAEAGDADAEQKLGMAYYNGQIIAVDLGKAFAWITKSANQGNVSAGLNLAYLYLNGYGTEKNPAKAFECYLKLANQGNATAQFCVAELYANGNGVTRDYPQAVAWYHKAADQGNASAELALGNAYYRGVVMPKDFKAAFDWFLKGANHGLSTAQLAVGEQYFYGVGTDKDEAKGVAWYQKAATQGNSTARMRWGAACLYGTGTPLDPKQGFTYLLSTARTDGYASYCIATCYKSGAFVARDPVLAYAWGLRASGMVHRDDLTKFMSDLKATLTQEQLKEAEKAVPEIARTLSYDFQSPDADAEPSNGKSCIVPFVTVSKLILIPLEMRDKSRAFLLFDTGSNASLLTPDFAAKMKLKANSYYPISGIGEAMDLGMVTDKMDLSLPGLTLRNARWCFTNFNIDAETGQPVVGVLGIDLIKKLVVRIDYLKHTIEFIKPESFKGPGNGAEAVPFMLTNFRPEVRASVVNDGVEANGWFLIDMGDGGAASLTKNFQDQNPALKIKELSANASSGQGGILRYSSGTCSFFQLGSISLPNAMVDLNASNQGGLVDFNGTIGNEIWRRFLVTIDFAHRKFYLQKNASFDDPFYFTTAGMHVLASGDDYRTLTVHEVLPDSAALKAGFQTGDVILKVDELGNEAMTLNEVRLRLHRPGTYHFQVLRDGQTVPLVLELAEPGK